MYGYRYGFICMDIDMDMDGYRWIWMDMNGYRSFANMAAGRKEPTKRHFTH